MDYLAHGLWAYIGFHETKKPWIAFLVALIPDTFSWGLFLIYNLLFNGMQPGRPDLSALPEWVFALYGISHSLIIWGLAILIIYLILRKFPIYLLAGPFAILLDIPTHSREFLPTPFLWPISNWYFPGFSWGQWWFMILNWSVIIILLSWVLWKRYGKKGK